MAGTFTQIYIHAICSTKNRQNVLLPEVRKQVYNYICGIIKNEEGYVYSIGGTSNHIHILFSTSSKVSISEMLKEIKGSSSRWINQNLSLQNKFQWQAGFGAFSVSQSQLGAVTQYINNQEEHHKKFSFKDEFRALLNKHNLSFDEKYIWD